MRWRPGLLRIAVAHVLSVFLPHSPSFPRSLVAWYEDWFDSDLYEIVYRSRGESDAEQLADLIERVTAPAPGAEVLDVGTGRGRHARVLARRGYQVTGLDLSENAVATARQRAKAEKLDGQAQFVAGDMRLPHFQARFDGVVNLFSTFGYFADESDHGRVIAAMGAALRPGGWLVQDLLNPPYLRAHLVPHDEREVLTPEASDAGASGAESSRTEAPGVRVTQERQIVEPEPGRPRVEKTITIRPLSNGAAPPPEARVYTESVRLLTPEDLRPLYATAGLETLALYGDYDGAAYGPKAPRLIIHARKTR